MDKSKRVPQQLTQKQYLVLSAIDALLKRLPWAPTMREIADEAGIRGLGSVHSLIKALEEKNWIERSGKRWRSVKILAPVPKKAAQNNPEASR